ncbi:transglutaminase domain-containing protein [Paenibacillus psychroresistens]|uniref:transglutaminase domain-containing protein n=1 Tax=Paenibacillus psychroresistens TaxID=1778678 RepID=UPI00386C8D3A
MSKYYIFYSVHHYSALETLRNRKAICNGYAKLTAALNRAVGIRTKIIGGTGISLAKGESFANVTETNHNWI